MFAKNVRTWLSRGGYFTPTPDTLFVSPERHALLNKFTQEPHDPGYILDTLNQHDPRLGEWAFQNTPFLTEELDFGDKDVIFVHGLIPPLPFAGYGYFVKKGGLLDQAAHVFDVLRTRRIAQLSFLITPLTTEPGSPKRRFRHSRYNHMLDVATMLILITEQLRDELTRLAPSLGFAEGEAGFRSLQNTLILAGMIHDVLTVAGGDGVKFVDEDAFDEDKLIVLLMELGKYRGILFDTWSINRDQLRLAIYGDKDPEGKKRYHLLNAILDLADKQSYTSRDVWQYLQRFGYDNEIGKIVMDDPDVCTLWSEVDIVDGKLLVTNYRRLGRFLRLRVLMFHHLYHGMVPRGGEKILGRCLCGFMYKNGDITLFNLLGHDDDWLETQMSAKLGIPNAIDPLSEAVFAAGAYDTPVEAHEALFRDKGPDFLGYVEHFESKTKSATDRFYLRNGDGIGTFKDLFPSEAGLVDEIHDGDVGKYRGYGLDLDKLGVRTEIRRPLLQFARSISHA